MYFESRATAGEELTKQLIEKYRYEDCAVLALTDGAVLVAEPIAAALHSVLTMLLIEPIEIPGEGINIGGLNLVGLPTTAC